MVPKTAEKKKLPPRGKGQKSLAEFSRVTLKPSLTEHAALAKLKQGTRPFPHFPLGEGQEMNQFIRWLKGVEGKTRHEEEAKQIAMDVSKALR